MNIAINSPLHYAINSVKKKLITSEVLKPQLEPSNTVSLINNIVESMTTLLFDRDVSELFGSTSRYNFQVSLDATLKSHQDYFIISSDIPFDSGLPLGFTPAPFISNTYHNYTHTLLAIWTYLESLRISDVKLPTNDILAGFFALLYHDIHHSLGRNPDSINVAIAIGELTYHDQLMHEYPIHTPRQTCVGIYMLLCETLNPMPEYIDNVELHDLVYAKWRNIFIKACQLIKATEWPHEDIVSSDRILIDIIRDSDLLSYFAMFEAGMWWVYIFEGLFLEQLRYNPNLKFVDFCINQKKFMMSYKPHSGFGIQLYNSLFTGSGPMMKIYDFIIEEAKRIGH